MRVCPCGCGYREAPIWRNTLRRLYQQHCHINDLEIWEPQLAKEIKNKKYVCKDGVKYKLNSKGSHVHRIDAFLCADPRPESPSITEPNKEKHKARVLGKRPNQCLLEVKEK